MSIVESIPKRGRPGGRPRVMAAALAALILCAAASRAGEVTLSVEHRERAYEVRGQFATIASPDLVWEVLADYGSIPRFVESMKQSAVESRDGARVRVRQEAVVGVFPVRRRARLVLDVLECRPERIEFRDRLGQDFHLYHGAWEMVGDSAGTSVGYSLDVSPKSAAPAWLGRSMMRRSAQDLLEQVRAEIERRARAK